MIFHNSRSRSLMFFCLMDDFCSRCNRKFLSVNISIEFIPVYAVICQQWIWEELDAYYESIVIIQTVICVYLIVKKVIVLLCI